MKIQKFFLFIVLVSVFTSCIPNKDLVYLQGKEGTDEKIQIKENTAKPYRVQINDIVTVTIKALDQRLVEMFSLANSSQSQNNVTIQNLYFNGYTVNEQGNIRVPVLGELQVLDMTTDEITQVIEKRLLDEYFKKESRIFVTVKLAGFKYTINGEVGQPGTNVLYQERVTIMEAIANSGDISMTGDRKNVQVIRKFPHGFETYFIDLTDIKATESPAFYLQPNDYIYIKPLKQKSWGTGTTGVQTIGTIITALSLLTTTILLTRNL